MQLDVTAAHAQGVLEPAPRRGERLSNGDADVLAVLVVDGDLAAGHLEVDAHDELAALALVIAGELQREATAHEMRMEALETRGVFADDLIDFVGMRNVAQRDLQWKVHARQPTERRRAAVDPNQVHPRACGGRRIEQGQGRAVDGDQSTPAPSGEAPAMVEYVNPAFEALTGYRREEVLGRTPALLRSGHHDAAFYRRLWRRLRRGEAYRGIFVNRSKEGGLIHEEEIIRLLRGADGRIARFLPGR